jgi:hypothetical protein
MIDFETLYQHPISRSCTKWQQCGSHCCTMGKNLQTFDATQALVALPIPEVEYQYLRANIAPGSFWPEPPRKLRLEFSDYTFTLYLQPCNFGGTCHAAIRPMICRMYPYIPYIDEDLAVRGVQNASAVDLIWEHSTEPDPCILRHDGPNHHVTMVEDLVSRLRGNVENYEIFLWWNLAYRYLEYFKNYLAESVSEVLPHNDLFQLLHFCNKTQLFLAEPDFKVCMEEEVQLYRRWMKF